MQRANGAAPHARLKAPHARSFRLLDRQIARAKATLASETAALDAARVLEETHQRRLEEEEEASVIITTASPSAVPSSGAHDVLGIRSAAQVRHGNQRK